MALSAGVSVSRPDVIVLPTKSDVARAAADRIVAAGSEAIAARGRFTIALSGGSTPRALFELLAGDAYRARVDWARTEAFFGDERCVPPDDPASNYRMAREALLDRVPARVHRMRGEDEPAAAAIAYEREMRELFGATPRFDLVLLGMGDNGHTASLFPGLHAVDERERWVVAEYVGEVSMWRLTVTPVVLNAAAEDLFLVAGADKAAMLHRVLEGPRDPAALPAQVVAPRDGRLVWLVDAAAAAALKQGPS
jgi:6-phosphogluconolactonase